MPSSISSSDIHYRDIPDRPWPKLVAVALTIVFAAMVWWEMLARSMQHIPGTYDLAEGHSTMWAEERKKLDDPDHGFRVLLIGSSRMLYDSDLDILEASLGTRPLQLAIPGTSPALFVEDIVTNTDFDGLMLVGVAPFLFNRLDEGVYGGAAFEWQKGVGPSQYTGWEIHKFLSEYVGFLDDGFALFALINRYETLPPREGAKLLKAEGWKLGNMYADRQTDLWPPIEVRGSFDHQQILNFWVEDGWRDPEPPERMAEMAAETIAFFAPLVEQLRARGGDMVFIRMPSDGRYLQHDLETNYRELTWDVMAEGFGALAINSMDYPQLSSELDIPEWSHLSRESQDLWSRDVVPILEERYMEFRGQTIYETMGTAKSGTAE